MAVHALKSNMRRAQSYTWATLPAAGLAGRQAWGSNFGTKGALLIDDGTRWKSVGIVTLASRDTALGATANVETIALQYLIPINMWTLKDRIRFMGTLSKSGTTNTYIIGFRLGTAGTVADAQIASSVILAAANRAGSIMTDFRLETATTVLQLAANSAGNPSYPNAVNGALNAAVTVTSAAANALFFTVTIQSSGATDTVDMSDGSLLYVLGGN